jgi:transcriptional regulator with XRE-family HTH domain
MNGDNLRSLLSRNLKRFRDFRGFSQQVLAEKADISVNHISAIERCERWPHPDILARLAGALSVEVKDLFAAENPVAADVKVIVDKLTEEMATLVNSTLELLGKVPDKE